MSEHGHGFEDGRWPFPGPENAAAICCACVLEQGAPILRVSHDEDDGCWQILCGGAHEEGSARVVCLGCMVRREPTLFELADLPPGWGADRDDPELDWERAPNDGPA